MAVGISLLIPRLRALLRRTIGPQIAAARQNLRGILSEPRKAVMLFGGNLGSQVAYALVLGASLHAYGTSLPLMDLIVINSLASLLGGLAPVPGGMGVIEAGLIGGMTAAGIPQSIAVAATFTARLFTAYLPPDLGLGVAAAGCAGTTTCSEPVDLRGSSRARTPLTYSDIGI